MQSREGTRQSSACAGAAEEEDGASREQAEPMWKEMMRRQRGGKLRQVAVITRCARRAGRGSDESVGRHAGFERTPSERSASKGAGTRRRSFPKHRAHSSSVMDFTHQVCLALEADLELTVGDSEQAWGRRGYAVEARRWVARYVSGCVGLSANARRERDGSVGFVWSSEAQQMSQLRL